MNDSENIKMNLNIGGQRIVQTVPFRESGLRERRREGSG